MQLNGKRIIVIGRARGIGEAVVCAYVAEAAAVASFDVTDDPGMQVATKASVKGPPAPTTAT